MKEKKVATVSPIDVNSPGGLEEVHDHQVVVMPPQQEVRKLLESDRMELELSKMRRRLAVSEAEKALSESNRVELEYKYIVLQIYMKYGLTQQDAIDEKGNILVGGSDPSRQK